MVPGGHLIDVQDMGPVHQKLPQLVILGNLQGPHPLVSMQEGLHCIVAQCQMPVGFLDVAHQWPIHHVGPGLLGRCLCDLNKQNNVITQL